MSSTLFVGASLGLVVAAAYLVVGVRIALRARRTERAALFAMGLFWLGVGAYAAVEAAWTIAYLAGADGGLAFALAVLQVKIVSMAFAFAGLVANLTYVYTGRTRWPIAALAYYACGFVALEAFYAWRGAIGYAPGTWGMGLRYANNSVEPWWTILLAALLLPAIASAIAYARLARVATEPPVRRRVALTSASLLVFFVPTLLAWRAGTWYAWPVVEKLLGLLAALGMLGAVVAAARDERESIQLSRAMQAERASRGDALRERARDLV